MAFAWASADPDAPLHITARFERLTGWIVEALTRLGLDARVGEVPGEYCPGEYSVNIAGRVKVMGVGQRVIRGGAHVGGVLTVAQSQPLRDVLIPIYEALELDFRPETAGGIADFDKALTPDRVIETFVDVLRCDGYVVQETQFSADLEHAAQALLPLHSADRSAHRRPNAGAVLRPSVQTKGGKALVQDDAPNSTPIRSEDDD